MIMMIVATADRTQDVSIKFSFMLSVFTHTWTSFLKTYNLFICPSVWTCHRPLQTGGSEGTVCGSPFCPAMHSQDLNWEAWQKEHLSTEAHSCQPLIFYINRL